MAKRFTDTEKWKKPFIKNLSLEMKVLWFYIIDDCDMAGLWHTDIDVACIRIGAKVTLEQAKEAFGDHIVEIDGGSKWFIPSFLEFQYGPQLSRSNNIFRSIDRILSKYDLYDYITIDIVEEGTTACATRGRVSKKVKQQIFLNADLTCEYCQEQKPIKELDIDHFIPINKGGGNADENLVCSCIRCNSYKSDLLPDDFLSRPHSFLNPTERIKYLLDAFSAQKAPFNPLLGGKEKDKDMDKEEGIGNGKRKKSFETFNKNDSIRLKWNDLKKTLSDKTTEEVKTIYKSFIDDNRPEFLEPYAVIWNMFAHENGLNQMEQPTDARVKKIKLRVNEQGFDFFKILQAIKKSRFAKGDNSNGWKVDFDFIIHSQDNYVKILEGKFN